MFLNSFLASYILMSQRIRYKVDIRGYSACTLSQKWARRTCRQGLQMFPTDRNASWMLWLQNPKLHWHHLFTAVCNGCTCCSLEVCQAVAHGVLDMAHYIPCELTILGGFHCIALVLTIIFSRSYIACRDNNYKQLVEFVIAFLTHVICQNPEEQEPKGSYSPLFLFSKFCTFLLQICQGYSCLMLDAY